MVQFPPLSLLAERCLPVRAQGRHYALVHGSLRTAANGPADETRGRAERDVGDCVPGAGEREVLCGLGEISQRYGSLARGALSDGSCKLRLRPLPHLPPADSRSASLAALNAPLGGCRP